DLQSSCGLQISTSVHRELHGVQGWTDHLETRALPEGPGSVGGPMRCPWYLFHRLFLVWARTQRPHDPLWRARGQ
ncbi:unnamed protein product, partial [Staurois parvus]